MTYQMDSTEQTTGRKRWMRRIWGALPLVFFVLLIWLLGAEVASKRAELEAAKLAATRQDKPVVNIVSMELKPMMIRDRINLPGVIQPWVALQIRAEVSGKVLTKNIEKGVRVTKGDIIAVIDSRDYSNAFHSAKASYDAAFASQKRIRKLFSENLATRSQLDDINAQVEAYQAQMDNAELKLERCTVGSPISGLVNQLYFEAGQYINVADPVADVLQLQPVKVKIGIPESDVNAVRGVDDFEVKIDALGGRVVKGKKQFLSSATDSMARLYDLELVIDNPTGEILPDMFARVEIVKQEVPQALAIPLYAVIALKEEKIVYVVENGVARSRKVTLGMLEGWRIQVLEGLREGEHVVVVGQRSVNDGQAVNVIRRVTDLEELAK